MPSLDPATTYAGPYLAGRRDPPPRAAAPLRGAGAWINGRPATVRALASLSLGWRSGDPAEAYPAPGNLRLTDRHRLPLLCWLAVGLNRFTLPLQLTAPADRAPRLRTPAVPLMGVAETITQANPALLTPQTITHDVTATSAGRALLLIEWDAMQYTGAVEYGPLTSQVITP